MVKELGGQQHSYTRLSVEVVVVCLSYLTSSILTLEWHRSIRSSRPSGCASFASFCFYLWPLITKNRGDLPAYAGALLVFIFFLLQRNLSQFKRIVIATKLLVLCYSKRVFGITWGWNYRLSLSRWWLFIRFSLYTSEEYFIIAADASCSNQKDGTSTWKFSQSRKCQHCSGSLRNSMEPLLAPLAGKFFIARWFGHFIVNVGGQAVTKRRRRKLFQI